MSKILDLFRKSPFEPVHQHMLKVKECIQLVRPLFESLLTEDYDQLQQIVKSISKKEHEADIIKNDIRKTLPKGIFLPVHRDNFLGYLKLQDDMADAIEDVAVLLTIKKLKVHPELREPLMNFVDKVLEVCNLIDKASNKLKILVEVAFSGKEAEEVLTIVEKAEYEEWESDKSELELAKKLFTLEDKIPPTEIFLWFFIFGVLGKLANYAEKTGDMLRRMLHKN